MRKISEYTKGNTTVKTYRDTEYNEYINRVFVDGVEIVAASYHTDDKTDALHTARCMHEI